MPTPRIPAPTVRGGSTEKANDIEIVAAQTLSALNTVGIPWLRGQIIDSA